MYQVVCLCGRKTNVWAQQAGSVVPCDCGQKIVVPSLSALKRAASTGSAAPTDSKNLGDNSEQSAALPAKTFVHLCGLVGDVGQVAPSSMNNFAGRVVGRIDEHLERCGSDAQFEILISCAIMPEGKQTCEVELLSCSKQSLQPLQQELERLINSVPVPYVERGPVAFAYYHRRNVPATSDVLTPFASLQPEIQQQGLEAVLMSRVGLSPNVAAVANSETRSLWHRVKQWWATRVRRSELVPTPESPFEIQRAWLHQIEQAAERANLLDLKQSVIAYPLELAYHTLLAAKFSQLSQWEPAVKAYSAALRLEAETPCLLGRRAVAQMQLGNTEEALKDYNAAISLDPNDAALRSGRADVYVALEAWQPAQEDLDAALQQQPQNPGLLYKRSQTFWVREQVEPAMADMHRTLQLDPNCGYIHFMLGCQGLQEWTDLEKAMWHLSEAVELLPDDPRPRLYRSSALLTQNKGALALEDCEQVLARDPSNAGAHGLRGRILHHENEYDAAIEACTQAIELGFEHAPVYLTRALSYFATERIDQAAEDCAAAQALDPEDVLAKNLQGHLSLQAGDAQAALEAFESVSRMAPQWIEPRQNLAWVHRLLDNPQAAVDEQSKLIAEQPRDPTNYVNRAFALTQMQQFERAAMDYAQALVHDPDNDEILALRGKFHLDRQQYDLALADFDRALSLNRDNDLVRLQRAQVYTRLNRYSEAASDYAQLIQKYPQDPRGYAGRAHALQMSGDNAAAETDVKRLSELAPEYSETHEHQLLTSRIIQARQQYNYQLAMELTEQLLEVAPADDIGYRLRACLNWDQELLVEALDDFTYLLDKSPDDPELLSVCGQILAEMGEWESAIIELDRAIKLSRRAGIALTLAFALRGRSEALSGLKRHEEALRDYEESVQLCPTNPWVYYLRGLQLFEAQSFNEARVLLELALEMNEPHFPTRKRQRAQLAISKCR